MGIRNSSRTRVAPVFSALKQRDPSGQTWLRRLLKLGPGADLVGHLEDVGTLPATHPDWWGKNERRLEPPPSLLRWLIRNVAPPRSDGLWGSATVKEKRQKLVDKDQDTIAEALRLLADKPRSRAWYVLEGASYPDACIETDKILLVVEGKRTENAATTATTWMPERSQILRHMDAAWEQRGNRRVLGLMIVEGPGLAEAEVPSPYWVHEAKEQVSPTLLRKSLPHRNDGERAAIAQGFLGVTTWQRVCREFGLLWPPSGL